MIGIDLQKQASIIHAAYNDVAGVTVAPTLNVLARLNRGIGSDFDLEGFVHRAKYSGLAGRIETFLVSRRPQRATIDGQVFDFAQDEAMQVEYSRKYTDEGFRAWAAGAGLRVGHAWNDPRGWFGLRLRHAA